MKFIQILVFFILSLNVVAQKSNNDLLPINPKSKNKPVAKKQTKVPILTDADDLLDIKSNEPNPKDLLDINVPVATVKLPNAGTNVFDKLTLKSNYTFNKKFGFQVISDGEVWQGDFYLNTKTGYSLLPNSSTPIKSAEGEADQIMGPKAEFYNYTKSSEGNISFQMDNPSSYIMLTEDSKNSSKIFFKTFKRTNSKASLGGKKQFKCIVYTGKDEEGNKIDVYLANAADIKIDIKKTYAVTGHFGLGYIAAPSGNTYLIAGIVGKTASIFLNYIENETKQFNGANYKPMGKMVGDKLSANLANNIDEQEALSKEAIANETDPEVKAAKIKAAVQMKKMYEQKAKQMDNFKTTSDINAMINDANDIATAEQYYDAHIVAQEERIAEINKNIKEMKKQPEENEKAIASSTCQLGCNKRELEKYEKMKKEHIEILKRFKQDKKEDKRDAAIEELTTRNLQPTSCNCN
jgi:hypothetical protein